MTGAHERWLFSTLFMGAKRALTGNTAENHMAPEEAEATADDDAEPISGVRTREDVLATPLAPRKRLSTPRG